MHPVLFNIGEIQIRSFGVFLLIAFLLAEYIVWRQGSKKGYNEEKLLDLGIVCFIYAFVFARIGYFLFHLDQFGDNFFRLFFIWEGGLDFSFGLIGGLIGYYYFIRRNKWSFFEVGDFFALAFLVAYLIGRIGSYFNEPTVKGKFLPFNQSRTGLVIVETLVLLVILVFLIYLYQNKDKFLRFYNLAFWKQNLKKLSLRSKKDGGKSEDPQVPPVIFSGIEHSPINKNQSVLTIRSGAVFFLALILLMFDRLIFSLLGNVDGFSFISNLVIIVLCLLGLFLYKTDQLIRLERWLRLAQSSVKHFKLSRQPKKEKGVANTPLSVQELPKEIKIKRQTKFKFKRN